MARLFRSCEKNLGGPIDAFEWPCFYSLDLFNLNFLCNRKESSEDLDMAARAPEPTRAQLVKEELVVSFDAFEVVSINGDFSPLPIVLLLYPFQADSQTRVLLELNSN